MHIIHKWAFTHVRVCVRERERERDLLPVINKKGRTMNNKIQYDRIIIFLSYFKMRENKDRMEREKKKIFVLWIDVGFQCIFFYQI